MRKNMYYGVFSKIIKKYIERGVKVLLFGFLQVYRKIQVFRRRCRRVIIIVTSNLAPRRRKKKKRRWRERERVKKKKISTLTFTRILSPLIYSFHYCECIHRNYTTTLLIVLKSDKSVCRSQSSVRTCCALEIRMLKTHKLNVLIEHWLDR